MRVIRFFLTTLLGLSILGGIGFLVTREALLLLAQSQVKSVATKLNGISKTSGYAQDCLDKIGKEANILEPVASVQMRFVDEKTYFTEVICYLHPQEPISIDQFTLPFFVTKAPGSSGIVAGDQPSGITLEIWGRKTAIAFASNKAVSAQVDQKYTRYPTAECKGFGYQCCTPELGVAQGEVVQPVLDCPTQCYTQCIVRPVVLSFVSDPYPDQATRQVILQKGESITFFYVFESRQDGSITGTIDFGDGQSQALEGTQGEVKHTYQCNLFECEYSAVLTLTNTQNQVSSVVSPLSTLLITIK